MELEFGWDSCKCEYNEWKVEIMADLVRDFETLIWKERESGKKIPWGFFLEVLANERENLGGKKKGVLSVLNWFQHFGFCD